MYYDKDDPESSGQPFKDSMNNWNSNTLYGLSLSYPNHTQFTSQNYQWNNDGHHDMDDYTLDPNVLNNIMSSQDLDLILSSDPTFIRQQQLLQEQQSQHKQTSPPPRSNLSAMLSVDKPPLIQPINLITSQQQSQNILNRRLSASGNQVEPIPIASPRSVPAPTVDHQRRFNELQARFRVNHVKKSKGVKPALGSSMPSTLDDNGLLLSSSYPDKRRLSFDPTPTTSGNKPILKLGGSTRVKTSNKQTALSVPTKTSPNTSLASSFPSRTMPIQIQRQHRPNSMQSYDLEQRQKRLDDQLVKADFDDITVSELKELLRQRGKPATGKKALLLQRLQEERDLILHARANNIPILNRYAQHDQAASLPELSSSPSGGIGSLNRSIADMHIGSPPVQQARRFAPYSTSPRASMNLAPALSNPSSLFYSTSMPFIDSDSNDVKMNHKNIYAPFASSALATPDHEEDINPFENAKYPEIKLEEIGAEDRDYTRIKQEEVDIPENEGYTEIKQEESMNWTDPQMEYMIRQGLDIHGYEDKAAEELLSFLANQGSLNNDGLLHFSDLQFDISELSNPMYLEDNK